ncbi:MAG: flagellar hook-basal body complex protein [Bacillota bacterium]|nr:flagellar hook-basal body complex protein [Bacillota bacterium]
MVRGLYIAGTNMLTSATKIDVIGNNMANVNTVGFKKDDITVESFNDVLISKRNGSSFTMEKRHGEIEINKYNDKYNLNTQDGYFRINTEDGISNNKSVKLTTDQDGYLSTYYLNSNKTINYDLGNRLVDTKGNEIFVGDNNYEISKTGQVIVNGQIQNELVKDAAFDVIGTINSGVKEIYLFTDFSQGQMKMTDRNLDVAINGNGYFEIDLDGTKVYSRNGAFKLNENNELVTIDGNPVQGINGNIVLPDSNIGINEFGEIIKDNEIIDKIKIIDFSNYGDLKKIGGTYFVIDNDLMGEKTTFNGSVMQRYLEDANVDSIEEMIKLVKVSKNYESSQKVISSIEATLDKVINEVGLVRA